jgi:hypothetical protein
MTTTTSPATHRATCTACGALSALSPESGTDYAGRSIDASGPVTPRLAVILALPVLPALVWWTCGACDHNQRA